ncbi:MAG: Stp1/IreP family PP2C-type Ser/Thr phosphatase [Lachnospiraceae bacterium]|nr:Stp1/IreP family PP2C-type Ser/Thr phosphatase [Lachnospiraceae bacterium]
MNSCAVTDIGQLRQSNQDFVYASDHALGNLENFYIVADGMGGHQGGGFASRYAVERITELLEGDRKHEAVPAWTEAVAEVNRQLYRKAVSFDELRGMGTTVVAATVSEGILYVLNVGDSRLYLMNDGIRQVTRDHSWVEEMIAQGKLVRGSELYYQKKNVITRAVGVNEWVAADFFEIELQPGDKILLCSDGLSNMVADEEILETVNRCDTCREAANQLIRQANANGGKDNISVVIVDPERSEEEVC